MLDFSAGRARRLLALQAPDGLTCAVPHSQHTPFLLSGGDTGAVHVWQVNTGALVASLRDAGCQGSATSALCWSDSGSSSGGVDASSLFAASDTGSIKLWDLDHSQVVNTLKGHKAAPACLSYCPHSGTLASGSHDTTVKLWDPRGREAVATLKGQGAAIAQVKHSPDGTLVVAGSEAGTIQVWDTRAARLLRELKQHTKRVTALAFHPMEQLLASASADRTVRFWDLGSYEQCDKAGPVAREVRALAFPGEGAVLLAAGPDGLRSYGWEPCTAYDVVDVPWSKVSELCCFDDKAFGLGFTHSVIDVWTMDLTQVRPFGEPRRPASCPDRRRLSIQEAIVQGGAAVSQSTERLGRPPAELQAAAASQRRPPLPPGPGPAAHFVAERRRQLQAGAPRPATGSQEVLTAPGIRAVPAQRNSPTRAPSSAAGYGQVQLCASASTTSVGSECSTPGLAEAQHSAAENTLYSDASSQKPAAGTCSRTHSWAAEAVGPHPCVASGGGQAACAGDASSESWGLEVADAVLVRHADVRAALRARAGRLKEVRALLARGDTRGVVTAVRAYQDLAITMHVVAKWAAAPDPPLELCAEAAALCGALLLSSEPVNQDAGVQMAGSVLRRWGSYIKGALDPQFARQGVDVEYESRRERCSRCREQLQSLTPALSQLEGNSKAHQLACLIADL